MHLFRRVPSIQDLAMRPLVESDLPPLMGLLEQTPWASLSIPHDEFRLTLNDQLSIVLEYNGKLWGCVLMGYAVGPIAWIRALIVHHSLRPAEAVTEFLQAAEGYAKAHGVERLLIMSDERDASWLLPWVLHKGYQPQLDVVGYEKRAMNIPAWGNTGAWIRPATTDDVPMIAKIDAAAFADEWVKSSTILAGVFPVAPFYIVAELNHTIVGYAFATVHHGGMMAHLVRIAVDPALQGQAIGVRLLAELVDWCSLNGVQLLSLNTQNTNQHAQRLYEWFGFMRNGERQTVLVKDL